MPNDKLSIAIPTYMRSGILLENLSAMLPQLREFGIPVYISDDSPDQDTEIAVANFHARYPFVEYRKNSPSLGHDMNCMVTLSWPKTEYVWYLGDSMLIADGGIATVIGALEKNPAFVFANCNAARIADSSMVISDIKDFLRKALWYLTMSGATVYSKRAIDYGLHAVGGRQFRNFQQVGMILAYVSEHADIAYWVNSSILSVNRNKKSYWRKDVVRVFGRDWVELVEAFPKVFPGDSMSQTLKSHSINHRFYKPSNMISFRADGAISLRIIRDNRQYISRTVPRGLLPFYLALFVPRPIASFCKKVARSFVLAIRRTGK